VIGTDSEAQNPNGGSYSFNLQLSFSNGLSGLGREEELIVLTNNVLDKKQKQHFSG